jgi:hypothetical protein
LLLLLLLLYMLQLTWLCTAWHELHDWQEVHLVTGIVYVTALLLYCLQESLYEELRQFPAADVPGLLQLAANHLRSNSVDKSSWKLDNMLRTGRYTAMQLPELEPYAARRLVVTAAVRQHYAALPQLTADHNLVKHLDASTVASVLAVLSASGQHLLPRSLAERLPSSDTMKSVRLLCGLQAAEQLSSSDMQQVLLAAVKHGAHLIVEVLGGLKAAEQMSSSDMQPVLLAAAELDRPAFMEALCGLPAAKQISSSDLQPALLAAAKRGRDCFGKIGSLHALCKLPAAQQISGSDLHLQVPLAAAYRNAEAIVCRAAAAEGHAAAADAQASGTAAATAATAAADCTISTT